MNMENLHDSIASMLYGFRFYRVAHRYAAKYLPPIHWLNYDDEPGE